MSGGREAFANRLEKNARHLRKWARREGVSCWRVYDKDLHDYACAIDLYGSKVHVQEYERPPKIDEAKAKERIDEVVAAVPEVLEVSPSDVFVKVRRRQKGGGQYEKLDEKRELFEVSEGGHRFLVNLGDYLDTGLFLDHRITRRMIGEMASGKRFLNLFAYTGSATVYAAKGGAVSTTTVDLSNTYLDWAAKNFELNGLEPGKHEIVRADCLVWIPQGAARYDLIFLDPPTFSTSKKMEGTFDVQRDHVPLIRAAARLLAPGGVLLFSNNFRRFEIDRAGLSGLEIEDITARTIPEDFRRNPKIHNAWRITSPAGASRA
jgi:23S rRNA (guanine2445-N2)-methyltransferase / 23S rRNA (guanine2069-N7)-methyltransferase